MIYEFNKTSKSPVIIEFSTWEEASKVSKETVRNAILIHEGYEDVKKRKCRTKQRINGKRFLREKYLSLHKFGLDNQCRMKIF